MIKTILLNGYIRLIKSKCLNSQRIKFKIMEPILLAIPGGASLALIAVAILLLFCLNKIPEFMKCLGQLICEFKKGKKEVENELEDKDK